MSETENIKSMCIRVSCPKMDLSEARRNTLKRSLKGQPRWYIARGSVVTQEIVMQKKCWPLGLLLRNNIVRGGWHTTENVTQ